MKKINVIVFCLLTFALMSSCDGNKKLEQDDAENTIKKFVQTNSFEGGEHLGQKGSFDVKSILLIEPIIQFNEKEASTVVKFNFQDVFSDTKMNLKFNFKRDIDKKWFLTSIDAISGVGSQGMSDRLQKWQNINILVKKGINNKDNKASITANVRYFLLNKVKDADGNIYNTVKIGTQVWMIENLKTMKFNDGTSIPNITDSTTWSTLTTPGYCWYNNDAFYKDFYGALYNWYTINTGKLAPKGWHVPTDSDWTILENHLIADGNNYDGTYTGNKIAKSLATANFWDTSTNTGEVGCNLTKNNSSKFAGLPGGCRYGSVAFDGVDCSGAFDGMGGSGYWWSSTEDDTDNASLRYLYYFLSNVGRFSYNKQYGFSVRCVRDN